MSDTKGINFSLRENTSLKKEDFKDKEEFKLWKEIDKVPKKENRLIAVVFREDKGAKILLIDRKMNDFVHNKHLYFLNPEATYITDNGNRIAFYLEGVSTPLSHANIEKKQEKRKYKDLDGTIKEKVITVIKGLKYDSGILQIFTDRKFAEVFTKIGIDKWAFYCFIGLMAIVGLQIGNMILTYYFRSGA